MSRAQLLLPLFAALPAPFLGFRWSFWTLMSVPFRRNNDPEDQWRSIHRNQSCARYEKGRARVFTRWLLRVGFRFPRADRREDLTRRHKNGRNRLGIDTTSPSAFYDASPSKSDASLSLLPSFFDLSVFSIHPSSFTQDPPLKSHPPVRPR